MANTKIPVELSSTPSIVDNGDATAITIDSSERVGIGTTIPAGNVHIYTTSGNASTVMQTSVNGSASLSSYITPNRTFYTGVDLGGVNSSWTVYDGSAGAERMRIDANGKLGVNTLGTPLGIMEVITPVGTGGFMVGTKSSESILGTYQVLTCRNTLSSSGTWYDVAFVSHSPNITVRGKTYEADQPSKGGQGVVVEMMGHYGSVSQDTTKQYYVAHNNGQQTGHLEYRYLNGGAAAGNYRLQVRASFSGGTHYCYTSITGFASSAMYEDGS